MIFPLNLFIHAASGISAAPDAAVPVTHVTVQEPDYAGLFPPAQLRRMSKVIRMGVAAANRTLQQLHSRQPASISVGTAYGCLQDTEVFLAQMTAQEEQLLSPTPFIQSTHNTVAGQIALLLKAHGRNLTFAQRGHSLEHAFVDARLYLASQPDDLALVGGIDELTPTLLRVLQQAGLAATEPVAPQDVFMASRRGTIAGEGAAFFAVSGEPPVAATSLKLSSLLAFQEEDEALAISSISGWLGEQELIDCALTGQSGDKDSDGVYAALGKAFSHLPTLRFKHLCGEYPTASGFALARMVARNFDGMDGTASLKKQPSRVAQVNHHGDYWSGWMTEVV